MNIIQAKQGSVESFGYGLTLTKVTTKKEYDLSRLVAEWSVYSSMFSKSMALQLSVFDGASFEETVGWHVGDIVSVVLFKDINARRVVQSYRVVGVGAGARSTMGRAYIIQCMSEAGYRNSLIRLSRVYKGGADVIARSVVDSLGLSLDAESMPVTTRLIASQHTPFEMLDLCMARTKSISMCYETPERMVFKTLDSIIESAKVHDYVLPLDKTPDGEKTDYTRILNIKQTKSASLVSKVPVWDNSITTFDPVSRTIEEYSSTPYTPVLGSKPLDADEEIAAALDTRTDASRHSINVVSETAFEQPETMVARYSSQLQTAKSFDQQGITVLVHGNPTIVSGDILMIAAPSLSQKSTPELDRVLSGPWLVGNIRHTVAGTERFMTTLDLFRDGYGSDIHRVRTQ